MNLSPMIALLRAEPARYSTEVAPHPKASTLVLADGSPAPDDVKLWAAFDNRYPTYLSMRRGPLVIANAKGVVQAKPMKTILKRVCIDAIRDELEGDEETLAFLRENVGRFVEAFPGFGVALQPDEQPDRVLWYPPGGPAKVITYDDDAFDEGKPFAEWVRDLFE